MGLNRTFLRDLITLKKRGLLDGYRSVVEIGAQQFDDHVIRSPLLDQAAQLFSGFKPNAAPVGAFGITSKSPPGRLLWTALGFQSQAIDLVGGDIVIDLNRGEVPLPYRGIFDFAVNCGTTEHIANQGNAFAAIHDLVRAGGLMYHQVPAFGLIDHGFFGYQPKFFHRIAKCNDYGWALFIMSEIESESVREVPRYLNDANALEKEMPLPTAIMSGALRIALIKREDRPFVMPADA
jgi:SAM-dependent methyltransferase